MTLLSPIFIVWVLMFGVSLQSGKPTYDADRDAPDAVITDLSWRDPDFNSRSIWERERQGMFSIKVKNTGTKNITAIDWEITMIDTIRQRAFDRFKFRTEDKTIKPGETKQLKKYIDYPTTPNYARAFARIVRLEFADGTVWEREKGGKDE